jgi:hypothetical protein
VHRPARTSRIPLERACKTTLLIRHAPLLLDRSLAPFWRADYLCPTGPDDAHGVPGIPQKRADPVLIDPGCPLFPGLGAKGKRAPRKGNLQAQSGVTHCISQRESELPVWLEPGCGWPWMRISRPEMPLLPFHPRSPHSLLHAPRSWVIARSGPHTSFLFLHLALWAGLFGSVTEIGGGKTGRQIHHHRLALGWNTLRGTCTFLDLFFLA